MKPRLLLHRIFNLGLALLVLTASVGLRVQRHTCHFSGRSTATVRLPGAAALRGCDGRLASRPTIRRNCCDFSSHLHQLNTPAAEYATTKVLAPNALALALPWPTAPEWPRAPVRRPIANGPRWSAADTPEPPAGQFRLARLHCWRV